MGDPDAVPVAGLVWPGNGTIGHLPLHDSGRALKSCNPFWV